MATETLKTGLPDLDHPPSHLFTPTHLEQPARHHFLHPRVDAVVELQARAVQEEAAAVVVAGALGVQVLVCRRAGAVCSVGVESE